MSGEMHQLILDMGFIPSDHSPRVGEPEYYHPKFKVTFQPVPALTKDRLAEALILGGMAVQKLETLEVIREAGKKLGFKF